MELPGPPPRGLRLAIFFFFLAVFSLSGSRDRPWGDANPIYDVAQNIVRNKTVAQSYRWPPDAPAGRDGKFYAFNPLLNSLAHVPGVLLREALLARYPATSKDPKILAARAGVDVLSLPWSSHLASIVSGALVCVLFFGLCFQHGLSARASTLATLMIGLGSSVWVYAHYTYTESLQTALFTGFLLSLIRLLYDGKGRNAGSLGLWAGLLFDAKIVYAAALPGAALLIVWTLRHDPKRLLRVCGIALAVFLPVIILVPYYNWLRFGAISNDGYSGYSSSHFSRGSLWIGLTGFLVSPGKSVFLYSPPLLLALWGWADLRRRFPRTLVAIIVTTVPVIIVYARSAFWHGDWAWGPRYLTFAVPALAFPAALALDRWVSQKRRLLLAGTVTVVLGAGISVQVLGIAFYWDHYIRIVREVTPKWLGAPNRAGSNPPDRGGFCDACFEDMYAHQWLPMFQPIKGHLWLARHVTFGHAWPKAEKDAPWHPSTTLVLYSQQYEAARIDWWALDWTEHRPKAVALGAALTLMLGLSAYGWRRSLRSIPAKPQLSQAVPPNLLPQ